MNNYLQVKQEKESLALVADPGLVPRKCIRIRNRDTGEEVLIDLVESRYRRLCYGFMNKLKQKRYFIKHIILTQREESYKPNILNPFFVKMRRYYGDCLYLWTTEIQEERYEKYGEKVLHWHVMFAFPYSVNFGGDDVRRIQQYWKYGSVEIVPVKNPNLGYLMKYITKSLSCELEERYDVRRIGSSRIEGVFRQSFRAFMMVLTTMVMTWGLAFEDLHGFHWSRGNAFVRHGRERHYVYHRPRSCWYKVEEFNAHDIF